MPVRKVRLDKLDATQVDFDMDKVKKIAAEDHSDGNHPLPIVAKNDRGGYSVLDGHHRVAAEILNGSAYVKARISKG